MTGFSTEWLSLREPLDRAARNSGLLKQAIQLLPPEGGTILDLGCGTGSTYRAFAEANGGRHDWRLADNDPALLSEAEKRCGPEVRIEQCDIFDLDAIDFDGVTLVTASALLDLCSAEWISGLADRLAESGASFYAALTYDGSMRWQPPDDYDADMVRAFNHHQTRDKGLGPALGPDAARCMERRLREAGYSTSRAPSPWRIAPSSNEMHKLLVSGIVGAVLETGEVSKSIAETWANDREVLETGATCTVGHIDLLARPTPE
ncbi:class I SAM-dependent methyltransferase [Amaricoccus macauensis]|uniref:class I SAM-dependent methyltransferase n=1 Tax=Amaricoccus macauensis TaxID=57001 RepID=UPI003C7D4DAD